MRVLFCHQSVGSNIIQGVEELGPNGFAGRICDLSSAKLASDVQLLVHEKAGRNGSPASKLRDFEIKVQQSVDSRLDLALLKFCYIDVVERSAAETLLTDYCATVQVLQANYPLLRIGHVTVPLRRAPGGLIATLRQSLQGPHIEHRRNAVREWFNTQLRTRFAASGLLFDLAAIESQTAQGQRVYSVARGQRVPSLAGEWTDDGGHLNVAGRRMAAEAFLKYLGAIQDDVTSIKGRAA
jgi:hypothetical protein